MEQTRPVSAKPRILFSLGLAVILTACALLLMNRLIHLAAVTPSQPLPSYGQVPAFALVDQDRAAVSDGTLRGHVWIADFIFTSCSGQCLLMTDRLAALQRAIREPALRFISFSVDPDRDTPEVLAAYAQQHGADARWRLLTGERAVIQRLSQDGFKLSAVPEDDSSIAHSTRLVLIDGTGEIRGYYEAGDAAAMARLRRDAARLLEGGA